MKGNLLSPLHGAAKRCPCSHVFDGFSLNASSCPICGKKREVRVEPSCEHHERNKVLEPLEEDDEHLIRISGLLNKSKVRCIDLFRNLDTSGDGYLSQEELRSGLLRVGLKLTADEMQAVWRRVDQDGSGELMASEFDRALKLVERKARNEDRTHEVDTWPVKRGTSAQPAQRYDWARRTSTLDVASHAISDSSFGFSGSGFLSARSTSSSYRSAFAMAAPWRAAANGPFGAATTASVGSGSVMDSSTTRQRLPDAYSAPGSAPVSVHGRHAAPLPAVLASRTRKEPHTLHSQKMRATGNTCDTGYKGVDFSSFSRGTKKFTNAHGMQSSVDEVVFNRDMDQSGDTNFNDEFTAMFQGHYGMPSWHWGR